MGWFGIGILVVVAILLFTLPGLGWSAIGLIILLVAAIAALNRYEFGRVD